MMEKKNKMTNVEGGAETEERTSAHSPAMQQTPEAGEPVETAEEEHDDTKRFDKIYSNIASNRYENLRTSYIENKAKEMRRKRM